MLDDAKIQELKAKYTDLVSVESAGGDVMVFRKPRRLEYDQWFDGREKGSQAALNLAQQCLVYPDKQGMMTILEANPALLMCKSGILDAITDLAGADGGSISKKL